MNLGTGSWHTTVAQLKMTFRNRITLFWSLAFPMILMTLLGVLFGSSVSAGTITVVDLAHTPESQQLVTALAHTDGVDIKTGTDAASAESKVRNGDRDGAAGDPPRPERRARLGRAVLRRTRRPPRPASCSGIVGDATSRSRCARPAATRRSPFAASPSTRRRSTTSTSCCPASSPSRS